MQLIYDTQIFDDILLQSKIHSKEHFHRSPSQNIDSTLRFGTVVEIQAESKKESLRLRSRNISATSFEGAANSFEL